MTFDVQKSLKAAEDFDNSEEGKKFIKDYFDELKRKEEVMKSRCEKVGKYLEKKNFDEIIKRLIKEHDETYRDKCYKKGYESYPNNKLELLWAYISREYAHIENSNIPQDFLSGCYFVKGYYFTVYCGQGCFYRIYDNKLNNILQT